MAQTSLGVERDKKASRRVWEEGRIFELVKVLTAELGLIVENYQEKFRVKYGRIILCSYKSAVWVAKLVAWSLN